MSNHLHQLTEAGVSIWLDDLSRDRIESGNLARLIEHDHVAGVTTNPSIFANALAHGQHYDDQIAQLADANTTVDQAILELITTDVRKACDLFAPVYEATDGVDGRVSIEVAPELAHDAEGTLLAARTLRDAVDRPNCYIKIPATPEGCRAIRAALADGIDINVTLIFGLRQYEAVLDAFVAGLEDARAAGRDLSTIHSVASFFVSRVDTEIDRRLTAANAEPALLGEAGVANARLAYETCEQFFHGDRWAALAAAGARTQRPLWASTGVKNPAYRDTLYVEELAASNTVNTMPEKTLRAFADHGQLPATRISDRYDEARAVLTALEVAGIDYGDVIDVLTHEGIEKFVRAWNDVHQHTTARLPAR